MAGLVNIVQALLAGIGERLRYDADQIIIDHDGMDIICAAAVLRSTPGRKPGYGLLCPSCCGLDLGKLFSFNRKKVES